MSLSILLLQELECLADRHWALLLSRQFEFQPMWMFKTSLMSTM